MSSLSLREQFVWIAISGSSMAPGILDGSEVLLDLSARDSREWAVVAFHSLEGDTYLHRILRVWTWPNSYSLFLEGGDGDSMCSLVPANRIIATALIARLDGAMYQFPTRPRILLGPTQVLVLNGVAYLSRSIHNSWLRAFFWLILPTLVMNCRWSGAHRGILAIM